MEKVVPTVTVVIPVFNGENYLEEAICSVLNQTYRDFEIVVVDDGSTDGTWAIIERYIAANPGVVRGIRKQNGGTAAALNAGIQVANGKYFAWLSHDDRFLPHKLEAQLALLDSNPEIVGVYSDYTRIDEAGSRIGLVHATWYPQSKTVRRFLQNPYINGSTLVVERRCLQEVGLFDEAVRYAHDALMWVHLIQRYQLAHIPEPLTEYRIHSNQATEKKRQAVRRDNRLWLSKAIKSYTVKEIFPELNQPQTTSADLAAAYTYLGDVLIIRHVHIWSGIWQYWKALLVWPDLRNPALGKALIAFTRLLTQRVQTIKRNIQMFRPSQVTQSEPRPPVEIYTSTWCEIIPDIRVTPDN